MRQGTCFQDKAVEFLQHLWSTGELSDFNIVSGSKDFEKEFKVHQSILSKESDVFAAMIKVDTEEKNKCQAVIPGFSSEAVKEFLEYFYTGTHVQRCRSAVVCDRF